MEFILEKKNKTQREIKIERERETKKNKERRQDVIQKQLQSVF